MPNDIDKNMLDFVGKYVVELLSTEDVIDLNLSTSVRFSTKSDAKRLGRRANTKMVDYILTFTRME